MSTTTTRFGIVKPDSTDAFLISDFQNNYDKIDGAMVKGTLGFALSASSGDIHANDVSYATIATVTVTVPASPGNKKVAIITTCNGMSSSDNYAVNFLYRDGVEIAAWSYYGKTGANPTTTVADSGGCSLIWVDTGATAGNHTYNWQFRAGAAVAGSDAVLVQTSGGNPAPTARARLWVVEL